MGHLGPVPGEAVLQALAQLLQGHVVMAVTWDFDGTLAPIIDDPENAHADPAAVAALSRLGSVLGSVVVITGRPARTAVRLGGFRAAAGLQSMTVLGQYGVERWDAATDEFVIPPDPGQVAALEQEIPPLLDSLGQGDAHVEHKGRAVVVHTRQLPDPDASFATLSGPLNDLAGRHEMVVEPGKNVLEIRSPLADHAVADDGSGIGLPSMLRRARETGGKLEAGPIDERTWHVRACWDAHTLASGSSEMAAGPTEPHRRAEEPAR